MRGACALITVAGPALVAGCSDPAVSITPPTPSGAAVAACDALDPHLPPSVDGTASSRTDPASPYTAAWGGITLSCGVPTPTVPSDAQLITVDGVDWYPAAQPQGGTRFFTVGRIAVVVVNVPSNHSPEADALVDLSPPIARYVPKQHVAPKD